MKLDFLASFADPVMQTPGSQGAFLAGVVLGVIAQGQTKDKNIESAPMFKQLSFGRMKRRDIKRHLSRVSELVKAYDLKYKEVDIKNMVRKLAGYAGELILQSEEIELGVDGNFAFATGFINSGDYFWKIFQKNQDGKDSDKDDKRYDKIDKGAN